MNISDKIVLGRFAVELVAYTRAEAFNLLRIFRIPLNLVVLLSMLAAAWLPSAFAQEESVALSSAVRPSKVGIEYHAGLLLGHILWLDPAEQSLFVKPIDREQSRRNIYIDRKTRITGFQGKSDKRLKKAWSDLIEGEKVAVRFIAKRGFTMAEEIFIVGEEFQPDHYRPAPRRVRKSSK